MVARDSSSIGTSSCRQSVAPTYWLHTICTEWRVRLVRSLALVVPVRALLQQLSIDDIPSTDPEAAPHLHVHGLRQGVRARVRLPFSLQQRRPNLDSCILHPCQSELPSARPRSSSPPDIWPRLFLFACNLFAFPVHGLFERRLAFGLEGVEAGFEEEVAFLACCISTCGTSCSTALVSRLSYDCAYLGLSPVS